MTIAAVIPAYDEEATIADIVDVLHAVREIDEIIVVSDGSEDDTARRARAAGARVIELPENCGKAAAMKVGFQATTADIILFLDADLIGLTAQHVRSLLLPVLLDEAEMAVGVFSQGRVATDLAQILMPYLSGQRAVRRFVVEEMLQGEPEVEVARFGIEVALTRHARRSEYRVLEVPLEDMSHLTKEEKRGLVKGIAARMKMYWEILKYAQRM